MTNHVMQREVCLKHRNNRREILLRVRTQIRVGSGVCSFLSYAARVSQPAPLIWLARPPTPTFPFRLLGGHRPRAGCLNANQAMPVQFRLTAPIFKTHNRNTQRVRRAPACAVRHPKPDGLGAAIRRASLAHGPEPVEGHRDAVPLSSVRNARNELQGENRRADAR